MKTIMFIPRTTLSLGVEETSCKSSFIRMTLALLVVALIGINLMSCAGPQTIPRYQVGQQVPLSVFGNQPPRPIEGAVPTTWSQVYGHHGPMFMAYNSKGFAVVEHVPTLMEVWASQNPENPEETWAWAASCKNMVKLVPKPAKPQARALAMPSLRLPSITFAEQCRRPSPMPMCVRVPQCPQRQQQQVCLRPPPPPQCDQPRPPQNCRNGGGGGNHRGR